MATILITGGAGGIGSAIARHLAAQGDLPVLADVDLDRAAQTAASIDGAAAIQIDVTDRDDCGRVVAEVAEMHGPLDGVVTCAALFAFASALDLTPSDFDRAMKVNVHGSLLACQAVAQSMIDAGRGGSMVLFSSGAANQSVGAPAYSTTKAAVEALTRELALAWAPHDIRVNAVSPGVIDSEMSSDAIEDREKFAWFMAHTPMRRMGRPDEVAATTGFLLSDASSYVTGSVIPTDGGFLSH